MTGRQRRHPGKDRGTLRPDRKEQRRIDAAARQAVTDEQRAAAKPKTGKAP